MARDIVSQLRHPKERLYGRLMTGFGIAGWFVIVLCLLAEFVHKPSAAFTTIAYIIGFAIFVSISAAIFRARIFGNYVLLSPNQFPDLHQMVQQGALSVGITPTPTAFVYNSNGVVNAYARRLFGARYIFLTSAIVEAETDKQISFVIGHELGHHAAGHLNLTKRLLKLPAHIIPFLAPAYSRGRELTCDRVGAYLCTDVQSSRSALQMLGCGCRRLNNSLNCDAFEAQENLVPPFWGWVSLIFARYPRLTQRVIAVSAFHRDAINAASIS